MRTLLTGNRRLARDLRLQYNLDQAAAGLRAWPAPRILPWNAWLTQTLEASYPRETFLSDSQEAAIWQSILSGATLLDVPATARACAEAWAMIRAWRLPLDHPSWQRTEDSSAFLQWAARFQSVLARNRWIESAALADKVQFVEPQQIEMRGFDELTPQQESVIARLEAAGGEAVRVSARRTEGHAVRCSQADSREEIVAAAVWARQLLETNAAERIGIVVPDLNTSTRPRIENLFRAVLGTEDAFNISLGWPLTNTPLVHAALLILRATQNDLPYNEAAQLVRSPFIQGAWDDPFSRARTADDLRKQGFEIPLEVLAQSCAAFGGVQRPTGNRPPSQWAKQFATLLKQVGWPGNRGLNSTEYQSMNSWRAVLSQFAALDAATGSITGSAALSFLSRLAAETDFQPETKPAPIQVLGVLEAAGSAFDAMWVMGMHDGVWPTPARPNPFIPFAIHREYNLPHSTAQREYEFASQATQRLLQSAAELVFSYPRMDGDQELGPSPLITPFLEQPFQYAKPETLRGAIFDARRLEEFVDKQAPPVDAAEVQRGGSRLLKLQAACPFRAYAEIRLQASEEEEPAPGLDPMERGVILHKALQYMPDMTVEEAVNRALTEDGMKQPDSPGFWRVERARLEDLLHEWLQFDKQPRKVFAREYEQTIEVGGLKLKTRIDRIDKTADGKTVLLDYKTTAKSPSACQPPRPDEPQLPLYAITLPEAPDAVAFAQVKKGEMKFSGFANEPGVLGNIKPGKEKEWKAQISDWRTELEWLATNFREGHAEVDPKNDNTCDECPIMPMCRIREVNA